MARRPPDGKLEASGSPWTSSAPEKLKITPPAPSGLTSESCFSAVSPVSGWNQWVKWVAPFSMAQSFIVAATTSATCASSGSPASMVRMRLLKISLGRRWRITRREKTSVP